MAACLCLQSFISCPKQTNSRISLYKPITVSARPNCENSRFAVKCSSGENFEELAPVNVAVPDEPRWENLLAAATSLYPLYVTAGGLVACFKPSAFSWFVERAPTSYSLTLGFIMLAMGITLELKDLVNLFMQRPVSISRHTTINNIELERDPILWIAYGLFEIQILYGCAAQYTIMPTFGFVVGKILGLSPSVSVGLILLGSCPGGTASNVVTLIARGDVPLSIVMTVCTTLGAAILTPLLTKILAGTYVPIDASKLSISTLQVVVTPVLLGSWLQSTFPQSVKMGTPFAPMLAVLASSLLASSIFSENVIRLKYSLIGTLIPPDASLLLRVQAILSSELGVVVLSVLLLHFLGFFVGYLAAAFGGFKEPQRRAISIEVGMQNSSLGVVLATSHFASSMVALPSAMSAVLMNIMGSSLGYFWRYNDPSDSKEVGQK